MIENSRKIQYLRIVLLILNDETFFILAGKSNDIYENFDTFLFLYV